MKGRSMKKNLIKKLIMWITQKYSSIDDYERNYCKFSRGYKHYKNDSYGCS